MFEKLKKTFKKRNTKKQIIQIGDLPVIGLVVTTFDKGGLEQVVLNLYNGYKMRGYKTYLLCEENILGVMAESVEKGELLVFDGDKEKFLRYLYDNNINVLHYHYNTFACEDIQDIGVHTIYTMHNVYTWKNDLEILSYNKKLNAMDKIIAVSNLVKRYYIARTHIDTQKIDVIYNGIDFEELAYDELPHELSRDALGLANGDITLGFVASFYPVKYQIGMLGVMENLKKEGKNIKLLLIGNSENEYYLRFKAELEKCEAKDSVIQLPYFEHKYVGAFLRKNVDIFVLPTLQEGCSNAVLEAIYCNRPMVLTDVGNASDVSYLKSCKVVHPAYTDIVTTSNSDIQKISLQKCSSNQNELVIAISEIAENLDEYKAYATIEENEKKRYETKYMVDQYVKVIQSLNAHR